MRTAFVLLLASATLMAQRPAKEPASFPLWNGPAPGALGTTEKDIPTLTPWPAAPERANGAAVVVCPGGGYGGLAVDHEGVQIAQWLNSLGVSAFVLRYRLGPAYHHPIELGDAARAMRTVRARAAEFRVDPNRIGIWGFSAGGHLASTLSTHWDRGDAGSQDRVERMSSRPDFAILAYPVITFTEAWTHQGSKRNLLGSEPDPSLLKWLSNDQQVTAETPPTFLFHTNADSGVPAENSVYYYLALRKAGVPAELHIYEKGPHGVGLAWSDAILSTWPARLADWMRTRSIIR
ncbi:MAG: alpha/beta hydrolase [Bryobacterales bacterium]|nr:alpha/beta hydrolase [Bryobacterales bacterium]